MIEIIGSVGSADFQDVGLDKTLMHRHTVFNIISDLDRASSNLLQKYYNTIYLFGFQAKVSVGVSVALCKTSLTLSIFKQLDNFACYVQMPPAIHIFCLLHCYVSSYKFRYSNANKVRRNCANFKLHQYKRHINRFDINADIML